MICDSGGGSCNDKDGSVTYSEDGVCCLQDGDTHQNAYKVLSVAGGTIAAAHMALFVEKAMFLFFAQIGGVLFVFHSLIKGTAFVIWFMGLAYVYQYLTYFVFFCHHNEESCEHPPWEYWVIRNLFYSLLILAAPFLAIQLCRIIALALVFSNSRERTLRDVVELESKLKAFRTDMDCTFSEQVVDKYRDVYKFMRVWMSQNDEDVSDRLEKKATRILKFLNGLSESDPPVHSATFDTFAKTLRAQGEIVCDARIREVWNALTQYENHCIDDNNDTECPGDASNGEVLTSKGLQDFLYELFFRRKELIHSIYTDHYAITFLARFAACFLYPATFIAISRVFGYQNAFGTGVDLFKVYLLAASYLLGGFRDSVMFMLSMLTDRPFNIGDILQIDGDTYKVRRFNVTHFFLDGPHYISVPINRFSSENTINLSKHGITDSIRISVPLNADPSVINRERIFEIMYDYQSKNDRDVSRDSLRCGWAGVEDGYKVMQCNWRYNFRIFDRSRLNWARADFRQYIVQRLEKDVGRAFLDIHIAGGGGYNDKAK